MCVCTGGDGWEMSPWAMSPQGISILIFPEWVLHGSIFLNGDLY